MLASVQLQQPVFPQRLVPRPRSQPVARIVGDPTDMLSPAFVRPPDATRPVVARVGRSLNRAVMRPVLAAGRVAMGGLLQASGFARRSVPTRMGRLNYFDGPGHGPLPPICLILGIGGTTTDYLPMLRKLRGDFSRVLALDLPGHGYSGRAVGPVDDAHVTGAVGDALDRMLPPGALLLGHSLGGYLAARYTMLRPARVRGLVLAEPLGAPFDHNQLRTFRKLYVMDTRRKARTVIHNAFWGDGKDNAFITSAAWARLSAPVAQAMIKSDLFTNGLRPEMLRGIKVPVRLIWGQDDHLLPPSHLAFFRASLPLRTSVVMPKGINHNNAATGPRPIIDAVVTFASQVSDLPASKRPAPVPAPPQPSPNTPVLPPPMRVDMPVWMLAGPLW